MLTGNNGILTQSGNAKEQTEIAREKEIIGLSINGVKTKENYNDIKKNELKKQLDLNAGEGKTELYDAEDEWIVYFIDSKRVYSVDSNNNIREENVEILTEDSTPGTVDGTGKESDPYIIMSIEDLVYLSQSSNEGNTYSKIYFKLGRTLNFKSELSYCNTETRDYNDFLGIQDDVGLLEALTSDKYAGFKPIKTFYGTFDGDNKMIKNLYENTSENAGLFNKLENGSAKNLNISGNIISEGDYVGSISALNNMATKIENCTSYVNIETTAKNAGGISGVHGIITNCQNYGEINGENNVGGIVGYNGTITNCQNYGQINGKSYVGGISGIYGAITNCKNYEKINGENNVGGISGRANFINKCINFANVNSNSIAGGIAGNAYCMANSINNGQVVSTGNSVGGIVGKITNQDGIINCYNSAKVEGNQYIGGIIGHADFTQSDSSKIINCYGTGEIVATNYIGGILGFKEGYGTNYIEYCYWPEEFNLNSANVKAGCLLEVNNSQSYSLKNMKEESFLKILNDYVDEYNNGDKEYSKSEELLHWKIDAETGYPTLEF